MIKLLIYGMLSIGITAFFTLTAKEPRIGPEIQSIQLSAFSLGSGFTTTDSSIVDVILSNQRGITATTINRSSNILSVTYLPEEISEPGIQELISASLGRPISKHIYPKSDNVCPIHEGGSFAWVGRLLN